MTPNRPVHLPSIEGLRAVETTARMCSFEKAALELNLTPSAVSKRVITLERLIGVSLFHRRANSLTLSEARATYVAQAREVLSSALRIVIMIPFTVWKKGEGIEASGHYLAT